MKDRKDSARSLWFGFSKVDTENINCRQEKRCNRSRDKRAIHSFVLCLSNNRSFRIISLRVLERIGYACIHIRCCQCAVVPFLNPGVLTFACAILTVPRSESTTTFKFPIPCASAAFLGPFVLRLERANYQSNFRLQLLRLRQTVP